MEGLPRFLAPKPVAQMSFPAYPSNVFVKELPPRNEECDEKTKYDQ